MKPLQIMERSPHLRLAGSLLSFDAAVESGVGFVSHCFPASQAPPRNALCSDRVAALLAARATHLTSALTPAWGQTLNLGGLEITLHPSGFHLGAAQCRVRFGNTTLLYTGPFNLVPVRGVEHASVQTCDVLVLPAYYGQSHHRFPRRQDTLQRISEFVENALKAEVTPVLLAEPLGQTQELAHHLLEQEFSVLAHPEAYLFSRVYQEFGVTLKGLRALKGMPARGEVLLVPSHLRESTQIKRIRKKRLAWISGQALDWTPEARQKIFPRVDAAFPLSRHGDHAGLLRYVEESGAREVYVVAGHTDAFVETLRARGLQAFALPPTEQLSLARHGNMAGNLPR